MRIAHVLPPGEPTWTGVSTVIVQLTAALAARGHEVEIWQHETWDHEEYAASVETLDAAGVGRYVLPAGRSPWSLRRTARWVAAVRGPDLVHIHSVFIPSNNLIASGVAVPYAISAHGGYDPVSLRRSRIRKVLYGRLFERAMLRRAALVCALTPAEARHLRAAGARGRVVVISNGVAPPPDVDGHRFRRSIDVDPNDRLGVFVGRLDTRHKGLDTLVDALAQAPGWEVAVIGPDERGERGDLERLARELGVSDRLHFTGRRDRRGVHEALTAADLLLLPSRWEGMPVVLLEALTHGTPALVTPPVARTVEIGEAGAGWVAERDRFGAMLHRLGALDEAAWQEASGAARQLAVRYGWDGVAAAYEAAYARAVRGRAHDPR